MSPVTSHLTKWPSMIGVTVEVVVDFMGSVSGAIHIFDSPVHVPAPSIRCSCILPGMPASVHACMHAAHSASVQPLGGGGICGCVSAVVAVGVVVGFGGFLVSLVV